MEQPWKVVEQFVFSSPSPTPPIPRPPLHTTPPDSFCLQSQFGTADCQPKCRHSTTPWYWQSTNLFHQYSGHCGSIQRVRRHCRTVFLHLQNTTELTIYATQQSWLHTESLGIGSSCGRIALENADDTYPEDYSSVVFTNTRCGLIWLATLDLTLWQTASDDE